MAGRKEAQQNEYTEATMLVTAKVSLTPQTWAALSEFIDANDGMYIDANDSVRDFGYFCSQMSERKPE